MNPGQTQALAAAIVRRAQEFTLPALLDALAALGLRLRDIEFLSNYTHAHQPFLVHSVEIYATPRRAVVCLNIGLLAAQSPLPSYFFSILEDGRHDTDAMVGFLALLDDPLLRERACAEYPERDRRVWQDWTQDKGLLLQLMALPSPTSLHWLFQHVYPELGVEVSRQVRDQRLVTEQVLLGSTALGDSRALGGQVSLTASAVAVTLYCEDPCSQAGRPWAKEGARRFDTYIRPLLEEQNLFLTLWLVFFDSDTTAHLAADPSAPDSFLGYDPLGQRPADMRAPRVLQRVLLHSGPTDSSDRS